MGQEHDLRPLRRLLETGIVGFYTSKWSTTRPKCVVSITKVESVDIARASMIFLILAGATVAALVILGLEKGYYQLFIASKKTADLQPKKIEKAPWFRRKKKKNKIIRVKAKSATKARKNIARIFQMKRDNLADFFSWPPK